MSLPDSILSIIDDIGYQATMDLVRSEIAGLTWRFPVSVYSEPGQLLAGIVGLPAAIKLIKRSGGSELYIPLCADALRADRNLRIIARYNTLLMDGHSSRRAVAILANEYKVSARTIERIVNAPAPAISLPLMQAQGSLF